MDRAWEGESWPLLSASKCGHLGVVRALIRGGANVDKSCSTVGEDFGATPLVIGMIFGHMDVLKELLRAGATPEVLRAGANPEERFMLFVMMLLAPGVEGRVNVQAASGDGAMLLRVACEKGFAGAVQALIAKGASRHLKAAGPAGEDALTPLEAACR